ncbi:MAG: hypothetical protein JXR49_11975 [Acidobacteria bacterium]|nr:hypothetical protein [Acidobacteriota bacterium]
MNPFAVARKNRLPIGITRLLLVIASITVVIISACSTLSCASNTPRNTEAKADALVQSSSGYVAVLLTNGQVFFGELKGLGTPYPVLDNAFYVQPAQNKDDGERTYVLIRRGQEAHGPDRMILNASHVVFIEPVDKDSKVAKLISESK